MLIHSEVDRYDKLVYCPKSRVQKKISPILPKEIKVKRRCHTVPSELFSSPEGLSYKKKRRRPRSASPERTERPSPP